MNKVPHLTPASLVGSRFHPDTFSGINVALVGYCPPPEALQEYQLEEVVDQTFIHIPPSSVHIGSHEGFRFLSIAHCYGGPVSSALIEELAYYGITHVLAYGLCGALGTKGIKMGDFYFVESARALDGTTPHYSNKEVVYPDQELSKVLLEKVEKFPSFTLVRAWTGDAIYREYQSDVDYALVEGCDIVNCDSSHLFAVSQAVAIRTIQCGVVSDVVTAGGQKWESELSDMLSQEGNSSPLSLLNHLIHFYIRALLPICSRGDCLC